MVEKLVDFDGYFKLDTIVTVVLYNFKDILFLDIKRSTPFICNAETFLEEIVYFDICRSQTFVIVLSHFNSFFSVT